MTLARAWRRQLYGASSAALIVPSAMLAALLVLALGGDFRQVGVLGQIFAGPPVPSATGGAPAGARVGAAAPSLPVIPAATGSFSPGARGGGAGRGGGTGAGRNRVVPVATRGPGQTGGAITPVGAVTPIVGAGGSAPRPTPVAPPSRPAPTPRPPQPGPSQQPTVVDHIVGTITPVTQQLPAPAGQVATQAAGAAAVAADSLLPPPAGSGTPAAPQGLQLR